ncbi:relaxase/mobilization nuclease domain-containing protein [Crocosphaera sp. Alani8]|uniref:relaxase/mobilization nuclease domain-containing protein n=1 Tax=Crocosphaera sp. Alani8 TaxID=3038952 RepID=UPI00313C3B72
MLLKFFDRGTGKGAGPVEYILKETDAKGIIREPSPELLKGNPQQTINVIDSLDFKHKYTSGVISFAASDAPTNEQLEAVINSFEDTAFAGLEPDQYDILWVKHTHTGSDRVELHFVTPRVELTSGKSLNIAPPGSNKYFEPWRDYWNTFQGWASPNDPQRARTYYPGYQALIDAQNHRLELNGQKPLKRDDARKMITNYLTGYIENGQIQNRNEILTTLENSGFTITRQGDNYITVSHDDLACIIHERIEKKPESLMQSGIWEFDSNNSL